MVNTTMLPERPDIFVAIMVHQAKYRSRNDGWFCFKPKRPYLNTEFWRNGEQIPAEEAKPIIRARLQKPLGERLPAEFYLHGDV